MSDPWQPQDSPEDEAARRAAYQRLVDAARRARLPLHRLHDLLRQVASNEQETRRFLRQVYDVPDEVLDEVLRARIRGLGDADPGS